MLKAAADKDLFLRKRTRRRIISKNKRAYRRFRRLHLMKNSDLSHIIRFAIPVAAENLITQMISMVISMLIGGITKSALAAVGLVN